MTTEATKVCTKCGREKPVSEFHKKGGGRIRSECKACTSAYLKAYKSRSAVKARIRHREQGRGIKRKAYMWAYRTENKATLQEKAKARYLANKQAKPVYTLACKIEGNLFNAMQSNVKYSNDSRLAEDKHRGNDY